MSAQLPTFLHHAFRAEARKRERLPAQLRIAAANALFAQRHLTIQLKAIHYLTAVLPRRRVAYTVHEGTNYARRAGLLDFLTRR